MLLEAKTSEDVKIAASLSPFFKLEKFGRLRSKVAGSS